MEEMTTTLTVGPFDPSLQEKVFGAINASLKDYFHSDVIPTQDDIVRTDDAMFVHMDLGELNHGAAHLFNPEGDIQELIKLEVPYILHDIGKTGIRTGADYSWHPSYGDRIHSRERDTHDNLILSSAVLDRLPPRSNEELGRAVRAYFADPGSDEAARGWPVWEESFERPAQTFVKALGQSPNKLITASWGERSSDPSDEEIIDAVVAAAGQDEPAVHLIGNLGDGFTAYGPYRSDTEAIDLHRPELEQVLRIFDTDIPDDAAIRRSDIDPEARRLGAIWVSGDLWGGYSARGIYRTVEAAIENNDGQDGFVVPITERLV